MINRYLRLLDLNLRGKKFSKPYVVFQSDDWGTIRIPTTESAKYLLKELDLNKSIYQNFDCLESEKDINQLADVLKNQRSQVVEENNAENIPIFTTNHIVSNPNFDLIQQNCFNQYYYLNLKQSYTDYYGFKESQEIHNLWLHNIKVGCFEPQLHGLKHMDFGFWKNKLTEKDEIFMKAFQLKFWSVDKNSKSLSNIMAAFRDPDMTKQEVFEELNQAKVLFKEYFGFDANSFIPPNYIFSPEFYSVLKKLNLPILQGMKYQFFYQNTKLITKRRINGHSDKSDGIINLVRNVEFNPSIDLQLKKEVSLKLAKQQIKTAFYLGQPAVIDSHRVNYVSGLDPSNSENGIQKLDNLLSWLIKTYPTVQFLSTSQLSKLYK